MIEALLLAVVVGFGFYYVINRIAAKIFGNGCHKCDKADSCTKIKEFDRKSGQLR
ncbi:hypothetical protein [Magnetospira sp. QH-2]|uniref:hypothetical protein n=1 Tax=Magnetospira sp. (strain QH-2) TaxID=1288970 RepID=UPI00130E29C8|nr:hypothetical protein [Magnetospira sp. QH-2]